MLVRDNEQLKAEVKELLNSSTLASTSRDQGMIFLLINQRVVVNLKLKVC